MTSGPTKIPPQQIPGQPPPAKPPGNPNVLLEKLPAELSDVQKTIEIKGRVIRDHGDGRLDIRTEQGDVTVKADRSLNVRVGDEVEIEIPPGRPPQNARVARETEALPPRTTQTPVDVEVRPAPTQPVQRPDSPPPSLSEGQIVRLQPLTPAEAAQYIPLPAETVAAIIPEIVAAKTEIIVQDAEEFIQAQIIAIIAPPANAAPLAPAQPQSIPVPAPALATQAAPMQVDVTLIKPQLIAVPPAGDLPAKAAIPPQPFFTLPASVENISLPLTSLPVTDASMIQNFATAPFRAQIAALDVLPTPTILTPETRPTPAVTTETLKQILEKPLILQNHKAGEIPAVVTGLTPQKLPVISVFNPATNTEMFFIMHVPAGTVLPGTEITLLPQQPLQSMTPVTAQVTFAPIPSYFLAPEPWPMMDEIYQTLAHIMPRAAQAMSNITPSPQNPAQLGPAALFFLAAVRAGDLTQWLGNNAVDALRRGGKSGLLSRLGQESSALNRLASDTVSGEWRAMSMPMMFENQMHKIALYYKNDSESQQKDNQGKQTRFIFDLSLDALGKVQLDGLFRAKRLDLIVRTLTPFSLPMQQDMRRIYSGALGETSITGDLSFQNKPEQWVTITPENKSTLGIST
jgi:hypothetical protein